MRRVEAASSDPAAYAPAVEAALTAYESASQQVHDGCRSGEGLLACARH
jgi:hypothetical protein